MVLKKIISDRRVLEKEVVDLCVNSVNFDFLYFFYDHTSLKISGWIEEPENQKIMTRSLGRSTGINFEALLFFIRKIKLWSQKDTIQLMAETLYERLDASNNDTNFLFTFSNPLKVIVLINEILRLTIENEFFNKNICNKTLKKYTQFAQSLIKTAIEEDQMYELLVDWDIEGRKLLYIIQQNSMSDLISDDKVQNVIEILWTGSSNNTFSIMNFSAVSQNLLNSSTHRALSEGDQSKFEVEKSYEQEDFIGRLSVWIHQIQFRHYIDQTILVIFVLILLAYFLDMFSIYSEGFLQLTPPIDHSSIIEDIQFHLSKWLIVPLFFGINLPLNAIVNLFYLREFEKNAIFNSSQVFDLVFAILTNLYIIFIYSMQLFSVDQIKVLMIIFLNLLSVFSYLRIVLSLTASKAFGIILQALTVIFVEVAKFFNTFIASVILFSFIGFILFNQIESNSFSSFISSLLFLVEAMFGQFSFADFEKLYPVTGVIFMLAFLYALAVILMNVLVAILAFNFEKTNRQARLLHYQHIIFHVRQGNYLQKHGCMITIPIIFEFLLIPYLIMKRIYAYPSAELAKVHDYYIRLSYLPILAVILLVTIIFNLVLAPFAYLKRLFQIMKLSFTQQLRFNSLLKWIFIGLPVILKSVVYDDPKELVKYLTEKESVEDKANSSKSRLSFDLALKHIFQTACRMYITGTTYCTISELFTLVREEISNSHAIGMETCVDTGMIIGVHLLKRAQMNASTSPMYQFSSPHLDKISLMRRQSTPLQMYLVSRQNSKQHVSKIDRLSIKSTFEGVYSIEEDTCELIYEYFERFCFKDIILDDENRDLILNLHNLLKLHEHYSVSSLNVVTHFQLYKIIRSI